MKTPVINHSDKFHVSFWMPAPEGLPVGSLLADVSFYDTADGKVVWNVSFSDGGYDRARRMFGNEYAASLLDLAVKADLVLIPEVIGQAMELTATGKTGMSQERELARCESRNNFNEYVSRRRAAS